jgi:tetratricopeptide (TPR) repeat protein
MVIQLRGEDDSKSSVHYSERAECLRRLKRLDEALKDIQISVQKKHAGPKEQYWLTIYRRASIYLDRKQYDLAIQDCNDILSKYHTEHRSVLFLAFAKKTNLISSLYIYTD